MNPIRGLLRDTWWLWLIFVAATIAGCLLVTVFYAIMFPVLLILIPYFAYQRYDAEGKPRTDI
jgi:hypothetical protein